MRRDETASKCFVQLVGNRKLVSDKALELPSLPVSELMSKINSIHVNIITASSDYAAFSVKEFIKSSPIILRIRVEPPPE